jgi:hypothetical protein
MPATNRRTTSQEQLCATLAQEQALDAVLRRCCVLAHTALEQRSTAGQRCQVSVTRSHQEAKLEDLRAAFPAEVAIHSQVVQKGLARLGTA